ncbi:MAG TPA: radical SAM protein [Ktedonobacteraceae bacterium]|nr:radical SAM protein [Ktedonobacteraceae bacterium]
MTVELRPLGVACNIACHYCYQQPQRDAGNFRQTYDLERMKSATIKEGGPFTLFGGEPLLLPLPDLEELFRWGQAEYGRSGIQTNGVLLNDEHIRLFKTYNVDVGVSIDGPGELNDLRWHVSLERTRRNTESTITAIERLCREYRPPGLITTLHRLNATAEFLPRLQAWVRQLDALGVRSMRLHLMEVESEHIRRYSLSDEENVRALLSFADLQAELTQLRFDVLDEMVQSLLGQDQRVSCVWQACDPYTTEAVHGVEGNGQSSNCGRTNKDGIDFLKAERAGYERYLALYQTPQEHGGCQGCRFFLMCKGQCPGTALQGDWRNRSELCGVWKAIFTHLENRLIAHHLEPLSAHAQRPRLEQRMVLGWQNGHNTPLHVLAREIAAEPAASFDAPEQVNRFYMPPFVRTTYVGEAQRTLWQPRLEAVWTALAHLRVLAVSRGMLPVSVIHVSPAEVLAFHNLAAEHELHARLLSSPLPGKRTWMVVGGEEISRRYRDAWEMGQASLLDELASVPLCCQNVHRQQEQAGSHDPIWLSLGQTDEQMIDLRCSPIMNILLRSLLINVVDYVPCGVQCEASLQLGTTLLALGREVGLKEEMDWLEEILAWPAEWTALHGIAEIKTGILKGVYHTNFTPTKRTVRYHGSMRAANAARGLSFAYQKPRPARRALAVQAIVKEQAVNKEKEI